MTNCIIDIKDVLFAVITPIALITVREIMGRISPDRKGDVIEGIVTGFSVLGIIYVGACL